LSTYARLQQDTGSRDHKGVSEGEIMKLCGWKTRAMFDRYNIIDEADVAEAVAKRLNGKQWQTLALPPHHTAR